MAEPQLDILRENELWELIFKRAANKKNKRKKLYKNIRHKTEEKIFKNHSSIFKL